MGRFSNLTSGATSFDSMMKRFGVVTVMNAKVYDTSEIAIGSNSIAEYFKDKDANAIAVALETATELCTLDTLKIANITQEGPTKTVNGGQYSNPLIKFGKSARLEMQDALGNHKALDALCGTVSEFDDIGHNTIHTLHITEDFAGPRTIVGDSFFIDQKTGRQVPVKILFYQFLPDSIFNLTQDAEGDATVFDMNGDLMTTVISIGDEEGNPIQHGVFYSIISGAEDENTAIDSVIKLAVGDVKNLNIGTGYTGPTDSNNVIAESAYSEDGVLTITAKSAGKSVVELTKGKEKLRYNVIVK